MFSALNIKVTIIERRPTVLDFVDRELIDSLLYFMRQRGATFRLGEKVASRGTGREREGRRADWRAERKSTATRCSTPSAARPTPTC